MGILKLFLKPIIKNILKYHARIKLIKLRNLNKPVSDKIANAISATLRNKLDGNEKEIIGRIERRRKQLNNSSTQISKTDFGSRDSTTLQTEEEMYNGVATKTTIGRVCQSASKPYFWSVLLFKVIREFKPTKCIELGTCLGISGAYQAAAQKLNKIGNLTTLEGSESLASIAIKGFQKLDLDNVQVIIGRFQDKLDEVIAENKPIDYVFIDGHHEENATIYYFQKILPHLSKFSIIIFDDISWSKGMQRAWTKIEGSEEIKLSIYLRSIGICVIDESIKNKYKFSVPLI